jgi:FKBP-type peptidyl-prolyl cis-trans isomerase
MSEQTKSNTNLLIWLAAVVTVGVVLLAIFIQPDSPTTDTGPQIADDSDYRAAQQTYLDKNALEEDVTVTQSGLQYRVVEKSGSDEHPGTTDMVRVHYSGRLIDGEQFDSSYSRLKPSEFPLDGVIAGWTEGLQLMAVGDAYEFTIPSDLAYGENGTSSGIRPGAALVFDVELLEIMK